MDVELGQDRALAPGLAELGQALEPDQRRFQPVDVQAVVQPGARRPVDHDFRTGQEHALRVADRHTLEPGLAVDRPLDPRDPDLEAGGGFDLRDADRR